MFANEDQIRAVELMAKNESCVADLYRVYAGKFPEVAEFWNNLVYEEEGHEKILFGLVEGLRNGEFFVRMKVFSSNVWESIVDIQAKTHEARIEKMTLKEALLVAESLEFGFLEQSYFQVVAGDGTNFKSALLRLAEDTQRHQASVKEMLARCL